MTGRPTSYGEDLYKHVFGEAPNIERVIAAKAAGIEKARPDRS